MSQIFRLYEPISFQNQSVISFSGDEHHILTRVLRMKEGDAIEILNGEGSIAKATLTSIHSKATQVTVESFITHQRPKPCIELMVGSLKGEKLSLVVQKSAELGVSRIGFFISDHSVAVKSESILDKSKKILIEAIRQSGNPFLPALNFYKSLDQVKLRKDTTHWNLFMNEKEEKVFSSLIKMEPPESITLFVGPEGGFSQDEKLFFVREGCYSVRIAPYTLRSETAAISALAACTAVFGRK